jgi:hypothetical protein
MRWLPSLIPLLAAATLLVACANDGPAPRVSGPTSPLAFDTPRDASGVLQDSATAADRAAAPQNPLDRPEPAVDLRPAAESLVSDVFLGRLTSCEAAAQLYETSPGLMDLAGFVAARSDVLAGLDPSLIAGSDGTEVQGFTDTGFRSAFRDGSNQVRHLAAAIQAGVSLGPAAALLHRAVRPDTPQDEALNDAGTRLGVGLRSGAIAIDDAANWIRDTVCE